MFKDGSQAWEARDFLVKQAECVEVVLEGKTTKGSGLQTHDPMDGKKVEL